VPRTHRRPRRSRWKPAPSITSPETERHGTTRELFTIWFGAKIMLLTIATGTLATARHSVDISWIVGLAVICPLYYALIKRSHQVEKTAAPALALVAGEV